MSPEPAGCPPCYRAASHRYQYRPVILKIQTNVTIATNGGVHIYNIAQEIQSLKLELWTFYVFNVYYIHISDAPMLI